MIEFIGWVGAVAFAIVNIPLAWRAHKTKDTKALPWAFMHLWNIGNACFIIYCYDNGNTPLLLDYILNAFIIAYVYYIKIKYK